MPTLWEGEQIRFQGPGVLRRIAGVLTITTERIVFSHTSGVARKREHVDFSMPLESVYSAEVEGHLAKQQLTLVAHGKGYTGPTRLHVELNRPPDLQQLIGELVADRRRALELAADEQSRGSGPRIHLTIHPTPATTKVMFRCPYCRTVYPELEGKCPSCGAAF
ncbi:MAG: hypothetical protein L3K11_04825 [Thermoplasmata archaeon]|nr:hypothetical protein [Thermoplasmata archaeon]